MWESEGNTYLAQELEQVSLSEIQLPLPVQLQRHHVVVVVVVEDTGLRWSQDLQPKTQALLDCLTLCQTPACM
jgi:hypothetical protein